jgi:ABC-type antimicrobial peptide transport system permease subunit
VWINRSENKVIKVIVQVGMSVQVLWMELILIKLFTATREK